MVPLSISSYIAGKSPEQAVLALNKAGFHYAELGSLHGDMLLERGPEGWAEFRKFAEKHGVLFRQGHLPLPDDICAPNEEARSGFIAHHARMCRMYHALGITAAVLHSGGYKRLTQGENRDSIRIDRTRSLAELLKELPSGMTICLENLPYDSFDDMAADLAACGNPPNLGLCLDTGHLHISRAPDAANFIRRAGKKLKALHLHDNVGPMFPGGDPLGQNWYPSDKHMFPGFFSGSSAWEEIIAALRETGYDGLWNLEVSGDLDAGVKIDAYRELVLRQDRERAELLFCLDFDAPQGDDPVNDFTGRKPLSSGGVELSFSKWKLHVKAPDYQLVVDPVHGGKISSWQIRGREILVPQGPWGWGAASFWQPASAATVFKRGFLLEKIESCADGFALTLSRTVGEDCLPFAGAKLETVQKFTQEEVTLSVRVVNTAGKDLPAAAFRLHCFCGLFNSVRLPKGNLSFADGTPVELDRSQKFYRIGEKYSLVEDIFKGKDFLCDAPAAELSALLPELSGKLHISFPGNELAAFYFYGDNNGIASIEPVFRPIELRPGESSPLYTIKTVYGK